MKTNPLWTDEAEAPSYPPPDSDLEVDVLIVGGGITGVSAAHLLANSGLKVALVERYKIGGGETSHTTAHLTYMTDTRLSELVRICGEDPAKIAWAAGRAALDHIERVAAGLNVEFRKIPGFLVAADDSNLEDERQRLREEAETAVRWGLDATYLDSVPPTGKPGIRFADQMKFHPLKYLHAIAADAVRQGVSIFEDTNVSEFEDAHVMANGRRIDFGTVVIATHVPLQGLRGTLAATLFQTKIASYSTYAVAARLPSSSLPEMIWSDTQDPFNYFRIDETDDGKRVIFGGADHKTGQICETEARFARVEKTMARVVGAGEITHRWSGQVVETVDGLPYIGEVEDGQFIATGFSGNGMTFGVVAAMMARDKILGQSNYWEETLDPRRIELAATGEYLAENRDFPYRLIRDRLGVEEGKPEDLQPGEGRVIKVNGHKLACCRDAEGKLHQASAVCPHLGCIVAWNHAERTWDCPCHGSRFAADGSLIAGPAEEDLHPAAGDQRIEDD